MKLRIAILGTRGIPNNYGGFEQFAEYLSVRLVALGHEVDVYNPSFHPYSESSYRGVGIKRINSPERFLGSSASNYVYDYRCLKDALKSDYDVIYEAGYASCAFALRILNKHRGKACVVTNMDGMEWQRSKWNRVVSRIIKWSEREAVRYSDHLVADNIGIQQYYNKTYQVNPECIAYGAEVITKYNIGLLEKFKVKPSEYFLLIARLEPENNIEMIVRAYKASDSKAPLLIVGNRNKWYQKQLAHLEDERIIFLGSIYNKEVLDSLRYFCKAYCHGHSVGGTNPSLLEAMACSALIIAHHNEFNKAVLGSDALYFSSQHDLTRLISDFVTDKIQNKEGMKESNRLKIERQYSWAHITEAYESFFKRIVSQKTSR